MKGDTPMTPPPPVMKGTRSGWKLACWISFCFVPRTRIYVCMINFCPDFCRNCPLLLPKLSATFAETVRTSAEIVRTSAEIVRTSAETPSAFLILRPNIFDSSAEFWHFDSSAEESKFYKIGLDTAEDEPLCFLAGSFWNNILASGRIGINSAVESCWECWWSSEFLLCSQIRPKRSLSCSDCVTCI